MKELEINSFCKSCVNSSNTIGCHVKKKFRENNKTQKEFLQILTGEIKQCNFYTGKLNIANNENIRT